jgi:hypothetical protein
MGNWNAGFGYPQLRPPALIFDLIFMPALLGLSIAGAA